jgi:hypothetical protein
MEVPLLDRFDAAVGDRVERAMIHHHMRRMRRNRQLAAVAPASEGLWAQTAAPPRHGSSLEVLIDGANALPRMAEAIRSAQRHVHVCSWHLEPRGCGCGRSTSKARRSTGTPRPSSTSSGARSRASSSSAGAPGRR